MDLLAPLGRQRPDLAMSPLPVALGKDDLGCPLGVHRRGLFGPADNDRHRLAFRIERDLVEHSVVSLLRLDVGLERGDDQGPFGRVSDDLPEAVVLGMGATRAVLHHAAICSARIRSGHSCGSIASPTPCAPLRREGGTRLAVRSPFR